ncbi:MAG: hypothetical protein JWQ04_2087 [Pedosphaera sp.]|nr:hypothetical protein [Pedosphaera sp.]
MRQSPARGRVYLEKSLRLGTDSLDQPFDLTVKAGTQFGINIGVITDSLGKLGVCLGMNRVFHRPAILRMRARD